MGGSAVPALPHRLLIARHFASFHCRPPPLRMADGHLVLSDCFCKGTVSKVPLANMKDDKTVVIKPYPPLRHDQTPARIGREIGNVDFALPSAVPHPKETTGPPVDLGRVGPYGLVESSACHSTRGARPPVLVPDSSRGPCCWALCEDTVSVGLSICKGTTKPTETARKPGRPVAIQYLRLPGQSSRTTSRLTLTSPSDEPV
jgi:hypothetical protein